MVSFDGALSTTAVSKVGLAFVAWTRANRREKKAFHKVPLLEHFVAARFTREFASRSAIENNGDGAQSGTHNGQSRTKRRSAPQRVVPRRQAVVPLLSRCCPAVYRMPEGLPQNVHVPRLCQALTLSR